MNVCAVDWGELSTAKLNYFTVSQTNTIRVANYLVELLLHLEKEGVDLAEVTLAGHSLGAHIAGDVGAQLRDMDKSLGTIFGMLLKALKSVTTNNIWIISNIGMDPAGPCYDCAADIRNRLDASDANYVQCIHSNSKVFGSSNLCGCSDIFLNSSRIEPISAHILSYVVFDYTLNANRQFTDLNAVGIHAVRNCGVHKIRILW